MASKLSPVELRSLKNGPRISIFYCANEKEIRKVMIDPLPKNMLVHFSGFFKDCLPPLTRTHVNRKGTDGTSFVTIVGGFKQAYQIIFKWMLTCCTGSGVQPMEQLDFQKYIRIQEAAECLDMEILRQEMWKRIQKIAEWQIPIEGVRMVYQCLSPSSPFRSIVVNSIGRAIRQGRLRNGSAYRDFKSTNLEYEVDIDDYLKANPRPEEAKKAERKALWANQEKEAKDHRKGKGKKVFHAKKQDSADAIAKGKPSQAKGGASDDHQEANKVEINKEGQAVKTKKVPATLARKGKKGQPTYLKVGLEEFGVDTRLPRRPRRAPHDRTSSEASKTSTRISPSPTDPPSSSHKSKSSASSVQAPSVSSPTVAASVDGEKIDWAEDVEESLTGDGAEKVEGEKENKEKKKKQKKKKAEKTVDAEGFQVVGKNGK